MHTGEAAKVVGGDVESRIPNWVPAGLTTIAPLFYRFALYRAKKPGSFPFKSRNLWSAITRP